MRNLREPDFVEDFRHDTPANPPHSIARWLFRKAGWDGRYYP
jgi:hypothetical protein